jgi:hypothetical protein
MTSFFLYLFISYLRQTPTGVSRPAEKGGFEPPIPF